MSGDLRSTESNSPGSAAAPIASRAEASDPDAFRATALAIEAEVGKVIVGQRDAVRGVLICLIAGGHALLEGVPGRRQDDDGARVRGGARALAQPRPVHARPAAGRHHRHDRALRGPRDRAAAAVRARPGLLQPAARRRDQPRLAAHPERAAGGDAGADGDGRRHHAPAAAPVLGARHPEPDRDAGHLPAARGAARPLPAEAAVRLPRPRGADRDRRRCAAAEHRAARAGRRRVSAGGDERARASGSGRLRGGRLRRPAAAVAAAVGRRRRDRARVRAARPEPARRAGADARGPDRGAARRPPQPGGRGHPRGRAARARPPPGAELRRRARRRRRRRRS